MMNASEYKENSSAQGQENCTISHSVVDVVLSSLYFLIFVPALVLNVTVMWVLLRLKTKSTFMVYLKNLVAVDLLMTLTVPVKAASELPGAALGLRVFACRFASVIFYTCMNISIILMGIISLDRFFKIVRPCGSMPGQSLLFGRAVSVATWVVLLGGTTLPTMVLTSRAPLDNSPELCMEMKSQAGKDFHKALVWVFNLIFWIILVLNGFFYTCIARTVVQSHRNSGSTNTKGKHKTQAKVFIVLAVFLVCFAPYHIIRIPYTQLQVKNQHSCTWEILKVAKDFSLWLSTTNICLDPLIYFLLCKSFRKKLSDLGILKRFSSSGSGTDEDLTNE